MHSGDDLRRWSRASQDVLAETDVGEQRPQVRLHQCHDGKGRHQMRTVSGRCPLRLQTVEGAIPPLRRRIGVRRTRLASAGVASSGAAPAYRERRADLRHRGLQSCVVVPAPRPEAPTVMLQGPGPHADGFDVINADDAYWVRVPDEIAVVGCDNTLLAQLWTPALTSVHRSGWDTGRLAVEAIGARVAGVAPATAAPPLPNLIVRGSSVRGAWPLHHVPTPPASALPRRRSSSSASARDLVKVDGVGVEVILEGSPGYADAPVLVEDGSARSSRSETVRKREGRCRPGVAHAGGE